MITGFPIIPTGDEELYRSRSNSRSGGRKRGGRRRRSRSRSRT